ncbi:MAG: hypothetical protein IT457_13315 [Planctomycetes bacterium]|nr:hypothetical protein [Planctomycetota bacterium]
MSSQVLPAAPRRPRFAATARVQARLAVFLVGLLLLPLIAALALHAAGVDVFGHEDDTLRMERATGPGRVVRVEDFAPRFLPQVRRLAFEFVDGEGTTREGISFAPPGTSFTAGAGTRIEYSPNDPAIARVVGTLRNPYEPALSRLVAFVALPGLLALLLALRDHARRRMLLVLGRECGFEILEQRVLGHRLHTRYRYRDERGAFHSVTLVLDARSPLAVRLSGAPLSLRVIHDLHEPTRHRLVHAGDFVADVHADAERSA